MTRRKDLITDFRRNLLDSYAKIVDEYAKKWEDYILPQLEEFGRAMSTKGKCILDAGCGIGRDCCFLSEKGFNIIGVDFSEPMLKRGAEKAKRRNLSIQFVEADLKLLPFVEDLFDGIWCCAVLLHIPPEHQNGIISEFRRVLKPRGLLFISNKNLLHPKNFIRASYHFLKKRIANSPWKFGETMGSYNRYEYLFLKCNLENKLEEKGFIIVKTRGITSYWIDIWASVNLRSSNKKKVRKMLYARNRSKHNRNIP